jgi:hypothetical protein
MLSATLSINRTQAFADFSTHNGLDYSRHVGALQPKPTQVYQPSVTRPLLPQDPDALLRTQNWRDLLQLPPPTPTSVNVHPDHVTLPSDTVNAPADTDLYYRAWIPPEPNESNAESRQRQSEIDSTCQAPRQEHLPPVPARNAIDRFANGSSDDSDIAEVQRFESSDTNNDGMSKNARKRAKAAAAAAALPPPPRLSPTGRALNDDEELYRTCNAACSRCYVCISCKGYLCQRCYTTISRRAADPDREFWARSWISELATLKHRLRWLVGLVSMSSFRI